MDQNQENSGVVGIDADVHIRPDGDTSPENQDEAMRPDNYIENDDENNQDSGAVGGGREGHNNQDEGQVAHGHEQQEERQEARGASSAVHPNPQEQELVLEGYDRAELIGQGAYGVVFKGRKRGSGEIVAIKRIPFGSDSMEGRRAICGVPCAVIREISLLRELDHPNVVGLLDVIQAQPGSLYLVFEFVDHDLKKYMDANQQYPLDPERRHGLPPDAVRNFMNQILRGVCFCHTYRVLHRDLKPHNLLISADGQRLKLADFGLARLSALPSGQYTHEVVTLWYRAPELLLGAQRYSSSVDVWSIGCIMCEMATGYALFPGRSDIDQMFKIFQKRGTPTPESWPGVDRMQYYNPDFPQWPIRHITDLFTAETLGGPNAVDLVERLLHYNPEVRIGCRRALEHPYFTLGP